MIIANATIITMNEANHVLGNGSVVVHNDRIIDVGNSRDIQARYHTEQLIDAKGKIVLPGLINSHTHLCRSLLRSKAADIPLGKFLKNVYDYRASVSKEEIRIATLLSCIEMVKSGTTCFVSHQNTRFIEEAIEATIYFGLRGVFARILLDDANAPPVLSEVPDKAVKNTVHLWEKYGREGKVKIVFGPMGLHGCSLELMRYVGEANREFNLGIHTHCSETKGNALNIRRVYREGEVKILQEAGMLTTNTVLVHCAYVSDEDIDIIADTGTSIVHCPSNINRNGNLRIRASRLAQKKINVAIGSDGPGHCHNLFKELDDYAIIEESLGLIDILRMATINGAKALGMEAEIGSLEAGKKADMIILDQPIEIHNISTILNSGTGISVSDVIIDGKFVMHSGRILTYDEESLLIDAIPYLPKSSYIGA